MDTVSKKLRVPYCYLLDVTILIGHGPTIMAEPGGDPQ